MKTHNPILRLLAPGGPLVIILVISIVNVFFGYFRKRALQAKYSVKQKSTTF